MTIKTYSCGVYEDKQGKYIKKDDIIALLLFRRKSCYDYMGKIKRGVKVIGGSEETLVSQINMIDEILGCLK